METLGFVVVIGATFFESTGSWIKDIGMQAGFHDILPSIVAPVYSGLYNIYFATRPVPLQRWLKLSQYYLTAQVAWFRVRGLGFRAVDTQSPA